MKMNHIHWLRRILVGITVFCLAVTNAGFVVQPVRAAGPLDDSTLSYYLWDGFFTPDRKWICLGKKFEIEAYFSLITALGSDTTEGAAPLVPLAPPPLAPLAPPPLAPLLPPLAPLLPKQKLMNAAITATSNLGAIVINQDTTVKVGPKGAYVPDVQWNKIYYVHLTYHADKVGSEKVSMNVKVAGLEMETPFPMVFKVKDCKVNIHGSVDMSKINGVKIDIRPWEMVGSYDVVGTLAMNEDGSLTGQATVNLFVDNVWTGEGASPDLTCQQLNPYEGHTTAEIEADPNAWANEGVLDLKLTTQPMPVGSITASCTNSSGTGSMDTPSGTISSFDLDFDALPAEGGSTSLNFSFPGVPWVNEMDLIVSPEGEG